MKPRALRTLCAYMCTAQHEKLLVAVDSPCLAVVIEVSWSPKRVVVDDLHVTTLALLRACAALLSVNRFCQHRESQA